MIFAGIKANIAKQIILRGLAYTVRRRRNYGLQHIFGVTSMRLLISAVTFEQYLRAGMCQLELVPMADKHNCAGVEFRPYWQSPLNELPEIKEFLEDYNLICTYACSDALLAESKEKVYESLERMKNNIDFAVRVGAKVMKINVAAGPFASATINEPWWQQAIRGILDFASSHEIVLAIENAPAPTSGDPEFICRIIEMFNSPYLKATFDTGNWVAAGYDPQQALEQLMQYIVYVHLKDIEPVPGGFAQSYLGGGVIDIKGLVNQLEQRGYSGYYVLEFPGGSSPARRIQNSLQYLSVGS